MKHEHAKQLESEQLPTQGRSETGGALTWRPEGGAYERKPKGEAHTMADGQRDCGGTNVVEDRRMSGGATDGGIKKTLIPNVFYPAEKLCGNNRILGTLMRNLGHYPGSQLKVFPPAQN